MSNVDTEVNPVPPLLAPNVPAPILFALISVFNAASPISPSFTCAALTASSAISFASTALVAIVALVTASSAIVAVVIWSSAMVAVVIWSSAIVAVVIWSSAILAVVIASSNNPAVGKPVALVKTNADGVPNAGVVNVALVAVNLVIAVEPVPCGVILISLSLL